MAMLPPPIVRRSISIPAVLVAALLAVVLTPIAVALLALVDVLTDPRRFRRTRIWLLVTTALLIELSGVTAAVALGVRHPRRRTSPGAIADNLRLEYWWAGHHARNLRRMAGLRWVIENPELAARGNAIVISRHASHADAILPVLVFGNTGRLGLRYTLKESLQWAPAMDIVGGRTPNVFVDRAPGPDSPVLDEMEGLAAGLDDRSVAVIFPEGTFPTPRRRARSVERLAETRPDLVEAAQSLRHLLPPRPAGTIAMLRGAPRSDVVFIAHAGMDSFGSIREIAANLPLDDPVLVRLWRIDRAEVPTGDDELMTWLLRRWTEIDRWIDDRTLRRQRGEPLPPGGEEIRT